MPKPLILALPVFNPNIHGIEVTEEAEAFQAKPKRDQDIIGRDIGVCGYPKPTKINFDPLTSKIPVIRMSNFPKQLT